MSRPQEATSPNPNQPPIERLVEALNGLRYGTVLVTIHDGRIVQIERTEKLRFDQGPQPATRRD